jgi:GNAT superfamily N-acetyltransferase
MDSQWLLELLGYAASVLVAVSLMMSSILRLRLINLAGALAFALYGVLIQAYPVAAVNLFIVFINLYYLRQMLGTEEFFTLLRVRPDSEYLRCFLDFHRAQVRRFFPGFAGEPAGDDVAIFVLRDMVPAGLFVGRVREGGELVAALDYVIPQYRDFRTGRYLFSAQAEFFREMGIRRVLSPPGNPEHTRYLRRMGFSPPPPGDGSGLWRREVG